MSVPIDITDDTLASSLVPVQCASLAPPALFKKGEEGRKKKEVLHLSRCYTHTGFTNHNKTITKTITFGIKNGPCETLPFLSLSFPFPFAFFFFPFPFPFSFLSLSFSSPFTILSFPFLYYSFSFSLSSLMWILWSRCEASAWKNDKRKTKTIMSRNTIWKGSGFLQDITYRNWIIWTSFWQDWWSKKTFGMTHQKLGDRTTNN